MTSSWKTCESLLTSNRDLSALLQGTVKCKKGKPPSTKHTRKEAFDRYMKIVYGLPPNLKIDLEDAFDTDTLAFYPEPNDNELYSPPPSKEDVPPDSKLIIPVIVEKKKMQEKKAPVLSSKPKSLMKVKPRPVEEVILKKPIMVERAEETPEIISPIEQPQPKTPVPPSPHPRTPTLLPPRDPSPDVPTFLKQFALAGWFTDLFPDKESIPSNLSADDFSLQLLSYLNTCSTPSKIEIFVALRDMHSQGLFENTDKLYQSLINLVPKFARTDMSPLERTALVEMLVLLMCLKSVSSDLMKKLLTLLAFKKLVLRETILQMLTAIGVDEAEQWLWPELESWDSELQHQSVIWKSLHDRADWWLELWISKYKEHNRYLYLRSREKWKPPSFSSVDVLNYFSSVQQEEYRKARYVAPAGHYNTVLLPLYDCGFQPILRLGETYSMARTRKPPGIMLPPLRNRPFLTHFPRFISFPLSRVILRPFHTYSDEDWLKAPPRRYFIVQQSYMEYYR